MALGLLNQSCKKTMVDLNTNPNLLSNVQPEFLFTGATVDINLTGRSATSKKYGTTMTYMQYVTPDGADLAGMSGYYWAPGNATGPNPGFPYYGDYFNGVGRDMRRIIDYINAMPDASNIGYQGLKAICSIVDTYHAWRVADIYGAMPYAQAFNDAKYPLPAYDYDYDLYKVFDKQLKDAAVLLAASTKQMDISNQDFFYGGDYTKWLAFANTLRIKIAQRYEKRDAANLTAVLSDIATNFGSNLIASNAGSFGYNHTRDWNNNVDDINVILFNYNASYPFVEFLKSTSDPRIKFMLRENDFGANYSGYRNVQQNGDAAAQAALLLPENQVRYWGKHPSPASTDPGYGSTGGNRNKTFNLTTSGQQSLGFLSAIQTRLFVKNGGFGGFDPRSDQKLMHDDEVKVDPSTQLIKMRTFYLSYAETCFMMAEIAEKGGNGLGKSASQWFYAGVQASFDQYKTAAVATNVPNAANVSAGSFVTALPYKGLPSIYSQAWVHFLVQPDEAWAMWKRTGYPQFTDVRSNSNGTIGDGSTIAYLENLWDGGKNLLIARRNSLDLSTGSNPNSDNYTKAIQNMITKDPAYGTKANDTKGRIWWDKQ